MLTLVTLATVVGCVLAVPAMAARGDERAQIEAAENGPTLIVGTKHSPPFAFKNPDGQWTGISIELWKHAAAAASMGCTSVVSAQNPDALPDRLIVAVREVPPFAFKNDDDQWSGISIDLLREITNCVDVKMEKNPLSCGIKYWLRH